MRKTEKIFRDPLYNYVSIDRESDGWLLELLDSPEVQRLRRIHQLGVSNFTYLGADHSRLSHTLGVLHLMQEALEHIARLGPKAIDVQARNAEILAGTPSARASPRRLLRGSTCQPVLTVGISPRRTRRTRRALPSSF